MFSVRYNSHYDITVSDSDDLTHYVPYVAYLLTY